MSRGPGAARRLISGSLLLGAASAALATAGPDALMPFKDAAGAASEVSVAFVVDFGSLGAPVVGCVHVPSTDNGYAALGAFTAQRGEAQPIYNNAGLLCSIDNLPGNAPTVCGSQVAGGYDYWSYWHGTTGSWVYASTGAFSTVQEGDVEGWRFETDGQSNPNDPHPSPAPSYASICGSAVSTPTTAVPTRGRPGHHRVSFDRFGGGSVTPKTSAGSGSPSVGEQLGSRHRPARPPRPGRPTSRSGSGAPAGRPLRPRARPARVCRPSRSGPRRPPTDRAGAGEGAATGDRRGPAGAGPGRRRRLRLATTRPSAMTRRSTASGRRSLHPAAWWLWAGCLAGSRHPDDQSDPAGPHRRRGRLRGVGPADLRAVVPVHRLLLPDGHGRDRGPGRRADRLRQPAPRPRSVHPAPGPPALLGGWRQHRRAGHRRSR